VVGLFNQTPTDQHGAVEILPTSINQTSLSFDVNGTEGMQYSLADITLADNYTEVQGATQVPNKTASAYFTMDLVSHRRECIQRFTNLTYGVTTAVISDPTINVHHTSVPNGWIPEFPSFLILPLFMIISLLYVITRKRFADKLGKKVRK
jgi:hypothetical protein